MAVRHIVLAGNISSNQPFDPPFAPQSEDGEAGGGVARIVFLESAAS